MICTAETIPHCPDCGGDWDREQCPVCGWTAKPLALARPGEVAEPFFVPACTWPGDVDSDIEVCCLCEQKADVLLHGVADDRDIPLCQRCHAAYLANPGGSGGGGGDYTEGVYVQPDVCLSYDDCAAGSCTACDDLPPARPVAPPATVDNARTPCASDAPDEPPSDRPAVAPYHCPDCGDPVEAQEQQCRACREDAGVVDPTHCAHLEACDSSSCAACEPRWRGQTGRSMVGWLNDDLPAFLVFFASLSPANKQETYQAIALVSENTPADVETFLSRSRARATALGML